MPCMLSFMSMLSVLLMLSIVYAVNIVDAIYVRYIYKINVVYAVNTVDTVYACCYNILSKCGAAGAYTVYVTYPVCAVYTS